jgi:hypothetical protein
MERFAVLRLIAVLAAAALFVPLGCGGGGGPSLPGVAVLTNEAATPYAADVVAKLEAAGLFARVDTIHTGTPTPSLPDLAAYDGVLIYSGDHGSLTADTTALGDVLADYVDQGGGLVVAVFAAGSPGWPELALGGRYVSDQYYLIPMVSHTLGSQSASTVFDSTHPIMAGFTSFYGGSSSARADTTAVVSGSMILQWADGKPLVVTSQFASARRVDLNFFPPSSDTDSRFWDAATDGGLLMSHSLKWVAELP